MNGISDRGSIPLSSIALKCWKYSILGLLLYKESALFAILDHFRPFQTVTDQKKCGQNCGQTIQGQSKEHLCQISVWTVPFLF